MTKNVFRPDEIAEIGEQIILEPPFKAEVPENAGLPEVPEYTGPTADDLRREAEEFRKAWETEKEAMTLAAKQEAESIVAGAKQAVEKAAQDAEAARAASAKKAEADAAAVLAKAEQKAAEREAASQAAFDAARQAAEEEGRASGRDAGYEEGLAEVKRLVQRCQVMLERIQDKRAGILEEAERQVIDLALLVTRKVVKELTTAQSDIVVNNIKEALRKVKSQGKIIVKVNTADLELSTQHKEEFIKLVEGEAGRKFEIFEDSSVDQGGCVVETDFGEIDARIASQLGELEAKIQELSPVRG